MSGGRSSLLFVFIAASPAFPVAGFVARALPSVGRSAGAAAVTVVARAALTPYRSFDLVPTTDDPRSPLHAAHCCTLLSEEEASWVVREAESFAKARGGWATDRHGQFPTTDFALESCAPLREYFDPLLERTVLPGLAKLYNLGRMDLEVDDLFVVKYEATGAQASLAPHYDDTLLSFSVLLSDPKEDFDGGGTRFPAALWGVRGEACDNDGVGYQRTEVLQPDARGDLVAHCGRLTHEGLRVTRGARYLLVGFVNVKRGRCDPEAYAEYLVGMGRLTHARRLARVLGASSPAFASRGRDPFQRDARAQLEYQYLAAALKPADDPEDGIVRPPEFTVID
mmetsp:Transcript_27276/g.60973  ORF Transcript_27276/g.60973 Transcript_27276/m.60973 type:complete len:339 (-) Transcript_27276:53-1069(-)